MDSRFFLPCFHGPRASRLGHKRKEKTRSITCRHGPRTRLIRGIYFLYQGMKQKSPLCPMPYSTLSTVLASKKMKGRSFDRGQDIKWKPKTLSYTFILQFYINISHKRLVMRKWHWVMDKNQMALRQRTGSSTLSQLSLLLISGPLSH